MPLVGGFGCLELVLYDIRVVVDQFLVTNLDIEWTRLSYTELTAVQCPGQTVRENQDCNNYDREVTSESNKLPCELRC